jgi:uncharacterized damage-inducible protein DinB
MAESPHARREVEFLLDQLERSMYGGPWHGPAVFEALEGVNAAMAASHPVPRVHSIWEMVHHLTVWIGVARRRMDGEEDACCLTAEEDFPPAGVPTEEAWQAARKALEESHRVLRGRLRELEDRELENSVPGSDPTVRGLVLGILQHNAYHGGQMVLLKKAATPPEGAG